MRKEDIQEYLSDEALEALIRETEEGPMIKAPEYLEENILHKIEQSDMKKGDVLGVARIAGIMGVKKTSELIPLCHPLMINKVNIDFDVDRANCLIYAYCTVKCNGKTGVEMEALTGVNVCLLTIYDMCKAVSKDMEIKNVHLVSKSGGKSGDFVWKE